MTDISVIILVGREELHIRRCLEKLAPLEPRQVFVVESQNGDGTHEIALQTAARLGWRSEERNAGSETSAIVTYFHPWPGNQAAQFNWALDALPIEGEWILRLDADEYLTEELIAEIKRKLGECAFHGNAPTGDGDCAFHGNAPTGEKVEKVGGGGQRMVGLVARGEDAASTGAPTGDGPVGFTLELRRRFCGGEIRHATNGIRQVRLFRRGCARYAEGLMDERLVVGTTGLPCGSAECAEGTARREELVADLSGAFYDDSLLPMDDWRAKHRAYAKREAQQAVNGLRTGVWADPRKARYYRLPPYFRAFAYFCIRYFLKGGFLDGYAGWMWNFWQGLWYRWIVDREIGRERRWRK